MKKDTNILESSRDHQDGQRIRIYDVEDDNERARFQAADIKRVKDLVTVFSYLKGKQTQILPGDEQRKDEKQENIFFLNIRLFHSESAQALEHIIGKLGDLHPWRCPKLDTGMALGNLQSSPSVQD